MRRWIPILLLTAACADEAEPLCPEGWTADDHGVCQADEEAADVLEGQTGVFGYIKERWCGCGPGDSGQWHESLQSQAVTVLDDEAPIPCEDTETFDGELPFELEVVAPHVVAKGTSDADGVFAIPLPPGEYCVMTASPMGFGAKPVVVEEGAQVEASFVSESIAQ